MIKKYNWFYLFFLFLLTISNTYGSQQLGITQAPQPTACISGTFSKTGNSHWSTVSLQIKNNCGQTIDFQNSTITFNNASNLNVNFWGNFAPLTYPDNNLQITSQPVPGGGYLATLFLHFPVGSWSNSKLPNGQSFTISYGVANADYVATSAKIYIAGTVPPTQTGEIDLISNTAKPTAVTQDFAIVDIKNNGQTIKTIQLPWLGQQFVTGLAPGMYSIQPNNVTDNQNNVYQGAADPASISLSAGQKIASTITYSPLTTFGKILLQTSALPTALSGYPNNPTVTLTRAGTGSTVTVNGSWNVTTTIDQLVNNAAYTFATNDIVFNNHRCTGTFTPTQATSNAQTPPTVQLNYACVQVNQVNVGINVSGLPTSVSTINVTFTPNSGTPITKAVSINNGGGTATVQLTQGTIYNVAATNIVGFTATFNPQPITANANTAETIQYQSAPVQTGGRVIGYVPGWKTPPTATALKAAGYTHVMIAFGVFSTTEPGKITPAFDTVTKAYIDSLHAQGIKAILSLGGALTSLPNTSVDFHQVLQASGNPAAFQQTFVASVKSLATQYGFDGVDIDIEHGLNGTGSFQNPTGDIAVMANILNQLHADLPNFLITLTPQTANIAATGNFDGTWANYSALIMKTHASLSWVGIQLYNSGCMLGIDQVCYNPNELTSPNFSVAMAVDLLANWPSNNNGQPTGFQPYISNLRPDQIVLGYLSANAQGQGDGSPVIPTPTIKRAIQCLKTGAAAANSCGTYVPPKAYGLIGGVFNWEVTFDQSNQFKFANDLKACAISGNC